MKDKEEPVNNEAPEKSRNEYEVPVKMIHPSICMSCPELEIENNQMEMWSGDTIYYINRLECKHYKRCHHLVGNFPGTIEENKTHA